MSRLDFHVVEGDLLGVAVMHYTLTHSLECEISLLLDPDILLELSAKHQELLQKDIVPFIRHFEIEIAFETPKEGMTNYIRVFERSFDKHLCKWRVMLFFIQQSLGKLKHVKC